MDKMIDGYMSFEDYWNNNKDIFKELPGTNIESLKFVAMISWNSGINSYINIKETK